MSAAEADVAAASAIDLAAQRIETETGLLFSGGKRRQFHEALQKMAHAAGQPDAAACAVWLLSGRWDAVRNALCARFLTVGETYFFREPRALDLVCEQARAHLARGERRPLRIWSAGCCTGEEPYSIAMALRERVPQLASGMASILATDLNEAFIEFARAGVYRRWSFRRTEPSHLGAHFRALADGRFEIDASLRAQVSFGLLNLASESYPSAANGTDRIDIVFCRNVLMYLAPRQRKHVVARLRDSLVDGGWLVVNASEASAELFEGFSPVYHADAVFFRKTAPAQSVEAPARGAVVPPRRVPLRPRAPGSARAAVAPAVRSDNPCASVQPAGAPAHGAAAPLDAALARARALSAAGARDEALTCLRRAAEATPLQARLHQDVALFALEHGDESLARDSVKRLLYLEPESALGHYLAALVEDGLGRRAQAVRLLHACRALAAQPGHDDELLEAVDLWLERVQ